MRRNRRDGSSLELTWNSFKTTALSLDCTACRIVGFSCMNINNYKADVKMINGIYLVQWPPAILILLLDSNIYRAASNSSATSQTSQTIWPVALTSLAVRICSRPLPCIIVHLVTAIVHPFRINASLNFFATQDSSSGMSDLSVQAVFGSFVSPMRGCIIRNETRTGGSAHRL
jgi:hypothetical protein